KTGTIKWQLKPENRKIGGFNCQKAVGDFGGRTYTVWFSTEIPINVGPWKLDGLPGVLVAGKEDSDRVGFSLNNVQYDQDRPDMPDLNFSVEVTITCEESFRLLKEDTKLFIKRLRSRLPREVTVGDADQVKYNGIQLECE
ncbi:MAG: GLPGLI family protein, partial [Flavobacteriaceae bacterium]|nr:GLPGLI family protein [Flavobacteriaceae bacterium]